MTPDQYRSLVQQLVGALEGYMQAVDTMNQAMKDGINVHGAIGNLIGCTDNSNDALTAAKEALEQPVPSTAGERADIIRKLKREVQWVPGKHYATQLEEIMDEAAALLQSPALPEHDAPHRQIVEQTVSEGAEASYTTIDHGGQSYVVIVKTADAYNRDADILNAALPVGELMDEQLESEFCALVGLETGINPAATDTKRALLWFKKGYRYAAQSRAQQAPRLTDVLLNELRQAHGITSNGRGIKEFTQVRDFARAILAAARSQPASEQAEMQSGWLPIESAPKTGMEVLLGHQDGSLAVAYWNGSCFMEGDFNCDWATHWRPKLTPPLAAAPEVK